MYKWNKPMESLAYLSMGCFALFTYSSLAASSLGHIFLILPGFYFTALLWKKSPLPTSAVFLGLYMLTAIITSYLAPNMADPGHAVGELRYYLAGILAVAAFTAALACHQTKPELFDKRVRFLLYASLLIAVVASVNGVLGLFWGYNLLRFRPITDPHRATGLYSMAITFGYGIQFMALISAGYLVFSKKMQSYFSMTVLVVSFCYIMLGLYFAGSRGALLGFMAGLPFLFARIRQKTFYTVIFGSSLTLLMMLVVIFSGGSEMTRFLLPAQHDSNMIRVSQYQAAYYAIQERPLLGHGHRNFGNESERIKIEYDLPFKDFISHAHNNYLEVWADSGLFGFLFFLAFQIFWFKEAWQRKDFIGDITTSVIVALVVSGLFQCTLIDAENVFAIFFIYGLSQVTPRRIQEHNEFFAKSISTG
jgi:O-antigen ligase